MNIYDDMVAAAHPDAKHAVAELHAFLTTGRAMVEPLWAVTTGLKAVVDGALINGAEDKVAMTHAVVERTNKAAARAVTEARTLFN